MKTISDGWYSAEYFNREERVLRTQMPMRQPVLMQFFQKTSAVLYGMAEAHSILRGLPNGRYLTIKSLKDGDTVEPWETVMTVEGDPADFCIAESPVLGVMARGTRVATNMRRVVEAANGKPVLFMGDRFDRYENQEQDGQAAIVGGASAVCTPAMAYRDNWEAKGTMPHALIACYGGDVAAASYAYWKTYREPVTALVDFNNDCVTDSLKTLAALGKRLSAVRLDTSEKMVDKSLEHGFNGAQEKSDWYGVNPALVRTVRSALDRNGGEHVKIVVSGGFSPEKIARFEAGNVPVDMYGVGSSIIKNGPDFTADIVLPVGKAGRPFRPNPRLVEV